MNTISKALLQSWFAAAAAFSVMQIASAAGTNDSQKTDQKQAEQRAAEFLERLSTGFQHEQRDDSWATREETRLRAAFMGTGIEPGDLKSVECRSSQCLLQIASSMNPLDGIKKQLAVRKWLSANVPCAYTMVAPVESMGVMPAPARVYVNCSKTDTRAKGPGSGSKESQ